MHRSHFVGLSGNSVIRLMLQSCIVKILDSSLENENLNIHFIQSMGLPSNLTDKWKVNTNPRYSGYILDLIYRINFICIITKMPAIKHAIFKTLWKCEHFNQKSNRQTKSIDRFFFIPILDEVIYGSECEYPPHVLMKFSTLWIRDSCKFIHFFKMFIM